ncbi:MAG: helix-turn-helix domain-containing protein [Halobacteriaceae archaeon]
MPHAEFTIVLPEAVWIGDLTRQFPDATFRVLSAFPTDDAGYALVELIDDDVSSVVDAMAARDAVRSVEVVQRTEGRAVVQFETGELPLLLSIQQAQVPLELPMDVSDGEVALEFTAPHDRVSAFGHQLEALNIRHRLDRLYRSVEDARPLTDKQTELLLAALERGYYDTPRECTLTELAEDLDMAPSTVSETLHRAEEGIVKAFARDHLDADVE